MATFLELCADLARESGAISPAPSTVIAQTGRQLQCVNWISKAWIAIQNASPYWSWLRAEFEGTLTIDDMSYSASDMGIATRFSEWFEDRPPLWPAMSIYDNSIGRADESSLRQISYEQWKRSYDFRTHTHTRPTMWAIYPGDNSLRFGSKPDKAYKVRGEYRKTPQVLVADADVPEMPARFHDLIWQRAEILMNGSDEAVQALQLAKLEATEGYCNLVRDCLPKFTTSGGGALDA